MKEANVDKEKMLKQIEILKQKYLKKSPAQDKSDKTN